MHSSLESKADLTSFKKSKKSQMSHVILTETRSLFCDPISRNICWTKNLPLNDYTCNLQQIIFNLNAINPQMSFIETAKSCKISHEGLWLPIEVMTSGSCPSIIKTGESIKLGKQVIKCIIIDPIDTLNFNGKVQQLYDDIFNKDPTDLSEFQKLPGFFRFNTCETNTFNDKSKSMEHNYMQNNICRICLERESGSNQFARNACNCSEQMPIHAECLIGSVVSRSKQIFQNGLSYYSLNGIWCEICKTQLKKTVETKNGKVPLFIFDFPLNEKFVVLELFEIGSENVRNVVFYAQGNKFGGRIDFGKDVENTLRFRDESIEGKHGAIYWTDQELGVVSLKPENPIFKLVSGRFAIDEFNGQVVNFCDIFFKVETLKEKEGVQFQKKNKLQVSLNPLSTELKLSSSGIKNDKNNKCENDGYENNEHFSSAISIIDGKKQINESINQFRRKKTAINLSICKDLKFEADENFDSIYLPEFENNNSTLMPLAGLLGYKTDILETKIITNQKFRNNFEPKKVNEFQIFKTHPEKNEIVDKFKSENSKLVFDDFDCSLFANLNKKEEYYGINLRKTQLHTVKSQIRISDPYISFEKNFKTPSTYHDESQFSPAPCLGQQGMEIKSFEEAGNGSFFDDEPEFKFD